MFRTWGSNKIYLKNFEKEIVKAKNKLKEIYGEDYYEKLFQN